MYCHYAVATVRSSFFGFGCTLIISHSTVSTGNCWLAVAALVALPVCIFGPSRHSECSFAKLARKSFWLPPFDPLPLPSPFISIHFPPFQFCLICLFFNSIRALFIRKRYMSRDFPARFPHVYVYPVIDIKIFLPFIAIAVLGRESPHSVNDNLAHLFRPHLCAP